ncbi:transcription factor IIA, alpha/beta subunit [Dactylonectria estremocensis]|uniref:Transcription initiation factor IIA large subunit n=1 Tax=Dactylonectria estremocensis TaxID=1079267 RepID=A0A9P9F8A4_9HYPO|nr:transcription factor IIA, alpha/beta subunit [Dactylonectria estremocensis]
MSNQAVGNVYQAIIDEVINSSRVDFEESGIEEAVLEELRQGWQRKLTQLDVAKFPWDPKPDPPAAQPAPPPVSAPPAHTQAQFSPQLNVPQGLSLPTVGQQVPQNQNGMKADASFVKNEPGIKQEPGLPNGSMPPPYQGYNPMDSKNVAAHRAAQQLQAQYGQRAASSINALHQQQQPQHQAQGQQQQTQIPQPPQAMTQQQQQMYRQQLAAQQQQQQRAANGQPHINNGQTDGAGDADEFEGVLMERSASGDLHELGRVEIDRMLHEQIAAKAKSMEGGGLMLPLKEATRNATAARSRPEAKGKHAAAYDGGDDEDDEDAINSDLDDPDEDRDEDEVDDEGLGHIMLCMYDKVQRVKNKWKCTLKDGVLTVNGKEYVFHKATGEYEW